MAHQIEMGKDGIVRVRLSGDMDLDDMEAYAKDFFAFLDALPGTDPKSFLVDTNEMGKVTSAARKNMTEFFRNPDPRIGYSAMVGGARYVRVLGSFVTKATGRDDFRFFSTEEEALVWLKTGV